MFDMELIPLCSFFWTVHIPVQNFTFPSSEVDAAVQHRERYFVMSPCWSCRDGSSELWQLCLHQAEVISWLEISVVLVRDVYDSIPALAQGNQGFCLWRCFSNSQIMCLVGYWDKAEPTWVVPRLFPPSNPCLAPLWALHVGMLSGNLQITPHSPFACFWTGEPQRYAHANVHGIYPCVCLTRRQQSRKKPCFSTGSRNLCLAEEQWFPHRFFFLFYSHLPLWQLLLVSACACLLPVPHPKPSLPLNLSPGNNCTFELINIFCLFYKVFCSLTCHISNRTSLLYFTSFPSSSNPDDSLLSFWREVAVPNPHCIEVSGTNATKELCQKICITMM